LTLRHWTILGGIGLLLACRPGSDLAAQSDAPLAHALPASVESSGPGTTQRAAGQATTATTPGKGGAGAGLPAGPVVLPAQKLLAPSDPLQRTARAALAGTYGVLPAWKRTAYQSAVDRGTTVRPGRLWVTHFWPGEGRDGQIDCRGNRCTSRTAACDSLPLDTIVWLENPCGLRVILDRGAARNDRQARKYGADFWLDRWSPGPRGNYMSWYAVLDNR
jgi:hypothetical protein